jgi:molybdopterin-guanine dinucleotide biosynthesis protein A
MSTVVPATSRDDRRILVTGAVLVGGQSRRMGRDKASMLVDGVPLAAFPVASLSAVTSEVLLVGGAVDGVSGRVVVDTVDDAGPLAGLVAALGAARTPLLLAAACDMPSLGGALLDLLIERLCTDLTCPAALCRSTAGIEPFPVAIRVAELSRLRALLERGVRAVHEALGELGALVVAPSEWSRVDPRGSSFVNWNRPEDVRQATRLPPTIPADD